jgi:hypothetical protein
MADLIWLSELLNFVLDVTSSLFFLNVDVVLGIARWAVGDRGEHAMPRAKGLGRGHEADES